MVEGSKAHSEGKEDRAKSTLSIWWGLNSLLERGDERHRSIRDESNASWTICMYTYLRNIGPLSFIEFSFPQKFESLIVSFDGSFLSRLLEPYLVILTSGRVWHEHTFLPTNLHLKDHHIPGNHGTNPMCFAKLPLHLIMLASIQIRFEDKVMWR